MNGEFFRGIKNVGKYHKRPMDPSWVMIFFSPHVFPSLKKILPWDFFLVVLDSRLTAAINPIGSMYGNIFSYIYIYTYICHKFLVHVGKYTIPMNPIGTHQRFLPPIFSWTRGDTEDLSIDGNSIYEVLEIWENFFWIWK